jgi:protein arginine kinase activator
MVCQLCKQKEATVHLTQIVDEAMKKLDLCEGCAKQKGVNDPAGFQFAELLLGSAEVSEPAVDPASELRCQRCGHSQADFKKTGRMGCSDCYEVFSEALDGMLKGMHRGTRHRGKFPAGMQRQVEQEAALERLNVELQAAIGREDFEQAARLRDEIKAAKAAA